MAVVAIFIMKKDAAKWRMSLSWIYDTLRRQESLCLIIAATHELTHTYKEDLSE